ncbi:hypothetical protein BKA82DRAFT_4236311, partial [Pisolithus tinctorius]
MISEVLRLELRFLLGLSWVRSAGVRLVLSMTEQRSEKFPNRHFYVLSTKPSTLDLITARGAQECLAPRPLSLIFKGPPVLRFRLPTPLLSPASRMLQQVTFKITLRNENGDTTAV